MGQYWTIVNLDKLQTIELGKLGESFWNVSVIDELTKPRKLPSDRANSQVYRDLAPKIKDDFFR
jgi:hypothetical protein